jgi:hypothetical protein
MTPTINLVKTYDTVAEGMVNRSVDLTPQLNYTGSNNHAPSNNLQYTTTSINPMLATTNATMSNSVFYAGDVNSTTFPGGFKPTQKELESANKVLELTEKPRRGRKPSKNFKKA